MQNQLHTNLAPVSTGDLKLFSLLHCCTLFLGMRALCLDPCHYICSFQARLPHMLLCCFAFITSSSPLSVYNLSGLLIRFTVSWEYELSDLIPCITSAVDWPESLLLCHLDFVVLLSYSRLLISSCHWPFVGSLITQALGLQLLCFSSRVVGPYLSVFLLCSWVLSLSVLHLVALPTAPPHLSRIVHSNGNDTHCSSSSFLKSIFTFATPPLYPRILFGTCCTSICFSPCVVLTNYRTGLCVADGRSSRFESRAHNLFKLALVLFLHALRFHAARGPL